MTAPDPYLRYASSTYPMTGWLLIERAVCRCEGVCNCECDQDICRVDAEPDNENDG